MPDQCATCGAGDALLFRCEYCDRQFCADHVFPSHACEHFAGHGAGTETGTGSGGSTEEGVGFEWGAGAPGTGRTTTADGEATGDSPTAEPADAFAASGFRPAGTAAATADRPTPREPSGDATPAIRPAPAERPGAGTPAVRRVVEPRAVEGPAASAVERVVDPRPLPDTAASAVRRVVEPRAVEGEAVPAVRDATPDPRDPAAGDRAVRPATGRVPERRKPPEQEPLLADADAASGTGARADGAGIPATTGAATAGDDAGSDVPIRPMDLDRSPGSAERSEPRTLGDWLRQQTYVSLTVKTGAIAALINAALYFGMLLATSGLLQRFLV